MEKGCNAKLNSSLLNPFSSRLISTIILVTIVKCKQDKMRLPSPEMFQENDTASILVLLVLNHRSNCSADRFPAK